MTYGFQVLNNDGNVIIDDTNFNFGLVAEGTLNIASGSTATVTYTNSEISPLIFVKFSSATTVLQVSEITSTYVTFSIHNSNNTVTTTKVAGTLDYRIYKPFSVLPTISNYGLQVFNNDSPSLKTFDSSYSMPKIAGFVVVPSIGSGSNDLINASNAGALPSGIIANPWWSVNSLAKQVGYQYTTRISPAGPYPTYVAGSISSGFLLTRATQIGYRGGPGNNMYWGTSTVHLLCNE